MKNVLIVCTANKTRSPMAMEIANSIARRKNAPYHFKSAGFTTIGSRIDENATEVLNEIGIQTDYAPTNISEYSIDDFDAIHVMSQRQKITVCSYFKDKDLENKITVLGIDNPYYNGIDAYRQCRDKFVEFYEMYVK